MSITPTNAGRTALRALAVATASLALVGGAQAQGRGWVGHGAGGAHYVHGGYYHGPHYGYRGHGWGWGWGGLGLGIGLGLAAGYYASPWYADPGYVVVAPPPVVYAEPRPVPPLESQQPVIYPRNGQSAAQIDADSNACSEWAGKQPNATTDPSVFRRGITACMDARGYTLR